MAKTFYILGEIQPDSPHEMKMVIGRGVMAPAKEAVHAEDIKLRTMYHFKVTGSSAVSGKQLAAKMTPRLAAVPAYASIRPTPRNAASLITVTGAAITGSVSFDFVAYGE